MPLRESAKRREYRKVSEAELKTFMSTQRPDNFTRGEVGAIVAGMTSVGRGLFSEVSHMGDRFSFEQSRHWLWQDCGTLLRWGRFPSGKLSEVRHPKKEANALYFFRKGNVSVVGRMSGPGIKKPDGTHYLCVLKSEDDYYFAERVLDYAGFCYYVCDGLPGLLALIKSLEGSS